MDFKLSYDYTDMIQEIKVGNETPFNIIVWSYNDCYLALVDQQNVVLLLL